MGKGQQPIKINTRRGRGNLECMDEVRCLHGDRAWSTVLPLRRLHLSQRPAL